MSQTRRLAAILAADVAGYSRLVGAHGWVPCARCPSTTQCRQFLASARVPEGRR
jgi:hypothetical protein